MDRSFLLVTAVAVLTLAYFGACWLLVKRLHQQFVMNVIDPWNRARENRDFETCEKYSLLSDKALLHYDRIWNPLNWYELWHKEFKLEV